MSTSCRAQGHTAHPSRAPFAAHTRAPILVFDYSVRGFCEWARRRLELLGFRVVCRAGIQFHDPLLVDYSERVGAVLVTTDKGLAARYGRSILLPMPPRTRRGEPKRRFYEEWWTLLARGLHELGKQ